jgi:hypothetical protein
VLCGVLAAALAALGGAAVSAQSWQDSVGYTMLKARLGDALPTGSGGLISLVEGTEGPLARSYPNLTGAEFTAPGDPFAAAVSMTDGSGVAGNGFSNHAGGMAIQFFGNFSSMAPGANEVVHYEAGHWLSSQLKYQGNSEPAANQFRVQNFSWVTALNSDSQDLSALRRFDWVIETGELTAVVGVNNIANLANSAHPRLLIHNYNGISVGRSDSYHSRGVTSFYGGGRTKPDLVAPQPSSSQATATVSSAAAMLHESGAGTDAVKSETMKAILMAGATKQEFANYLEQVPPVTTIPPTPPSLAPKPWDRTPTRPLDEIFGAGELNVYNSYLIQHGGQHAGSQAAPTTTAGSFGWDYQNHKGDPGVGDLYYNFEIDAGSTAEELSIILAWNIKITDTNPAAGTFTPVESLQNLDLEFYDSTGSFMDNMLDHSISTVDNVEHIYLTDLNPGTYTLKVSGAADWDFGLAWRMATKFDQVSADFDEDGDVDGMDFLTWQRNLGTLLGATHGEGDADGDGDVDDVDLQAVRNGVMPITPPPMAGGGAAAVPEPNSLALAAGVLLASAGWTRRRHGRG